jgi:hypothetical protein
MHYGHVRAVHDTIPPNRRGREDDMSPVPTLVVLAVFVVAALGCIGLWVFTDNRARLRELREESSRPPMTSGDDDVRPVLPGAAPTTTRASDQVRSKHRPHRRCAGGPPGLRLPSQHRTEKTPLPRGGLVRIPAEGSVHGRRET